MTLEARAGSIRSLILWVALGALACSSPPNFPDDATRLRDDLFVQAIRPGVWRHVSYRRYPAGLFPSNGLVVQTDSGRALLVDTAWNPEQTSALLDWVEAEIGPASALLITHVHDDRLGGISEAHRRGVRSIALRATAELALADDWPAIEQAVDSGFQLEALGLRGEIFFPGAGHSSDNAVVYLEDSKILAGTCMVREAGAPSVGNTSDADLESWPASIRSLQKRYAEAQVIVPGHGTPGGQELLSHTLELLANREQ